MSGHRQPDSSQSGRSSDDASSPRSILGKMILPRLDGPLYEVAATQKRIAHACERCRALKAKCTGGLRCEKCVADKVDCRYGDGKRERNKKEMASQLQKSTSLTQQNEQLLAALREVCADPAFSAQTHPAVMQLLSKYPTESGPGAMNLSGSRGQLEDRVPVDEGETLISASVGSPGAADRLVRLVSLGIGSGASGYVGKSSEISWLQRAQEQISPQHHDVNDMLPDLDEDHPDGSLWDYHVDEANLLAVDEDSVDPMEVPPGPIAGTLAESYFETVHGSFPLVDKGTFMDVLRTQFHSRAPLSWEGRRWLSMANIIFAVGAKWMYLTRPQRADMQGPNIGLGDHIVYYARARSLGLDHRLIMDHPLLEQIQALGILSLYLIVNHQISRAWTTIGHAIRHAIALGLHLRVGAGIDISQQKLRSRTWWSLYNLEQLLGDFTGRPTSILITDIATPLDLAHGNDMPSQPLRTRPKPAPAPQARQDQTLAGLNPVPDSPQPYFVWRVRLSIIGHQIRSSLYSCRQPNEAWSRVQQNIREFDQELTQWSVDLPEEMRLPEGIDFQSAHRRGGQLLNHFELALSYQSTRMILFRPCLCHLEGVIPNESALSRSFNQEAATSCVAAARSLLALLPGEPAGAHTSKILPWWSLLHYITQAGAVLILELSLKAEHMPNQLKALLEDMGKIMRWLAEMAADSMSAWRSWNIFRKLSSQAAAGVGVNIVVPDDVPKPPGWKAAYEKLLSPRRSVAVDAQRNPPSSDHVTQPAPTPQPNALFPIAGPAGEMGDASWPLVSAMDDSTGDSAFTGRETYPRSTGQSASEGEMEMDWRT